MRCASPGRDPGRQPRSHRASAAADRQGRRGPGRRLDRPQPDAKLAGARRAAGLDPQVRFAIAAPVRAAPPADVAALLAGLPDRRPDRWRCNSAITPRMRTCARRSSASSRRSCSGGSGDRIRPMFARPARPRPSTCPSSIAIRDRWPRARATRLVLHEQYQSRLDDASAALRVSTRSATPHRGCPEGGRCGGRG